MKTIQVNSELGGEIISRKFRANMKIIQKQGSIKKEYSINYHYIQLKWNYYTISNISITLVELYKTPGRLSQTLFGKVDAVFFFTIIV